MKNKRKDHVVKLLNKPKHPLQMNMLWLFLGEKNFCHRSNGELIKQLLACSVLTRCTDIDENQIFSNYHSVLGGHLG